MDSSGYGHLKIRSKAINQIHTIDHHSKQARIPPVIEPGKPADFVLLDADPVNCDPLDIRNISVVQAIEVSEVIFNR